MTKKSAMTMAFGLALALLVGVAAMSLTFGGTSVANASRVRKPIVKHQVQTVTVHRQAKAPASSGGVRIVHLNSSAPTSTYQSTSASSSDGFESESGDDGYGSSHSGAGGGSYGDD